MIRHTGTNGLIGLAAWLGISYLAAGVGAIASVDAGGFYAQLARPDWAPPGWVFGPVWTLLYGLMGVAAWLVWRSTDRTRPVLTLFLIQLAVNALWSWLFFAWHLGGAALANILLLWPLILLTTLGFWRVRPLAGMLLLPYLTWVGFAALLNFAVWRLNPGLL
ncbi:TspO/MBR family protein [Thiohalobacter thiocyanaticus]|uniref:Tryptophan-rich sensory protein n=1 Tax=Thiohalobacter thiocyanaticus TaxID=585455 RepID=A0A426QJW8_9GAMM|nr:TspO/MBR family protein [Thiohalobacter thiocyanaticus]RRQ22045.1 tryptophan-rich sensory protein [Thiohalobacter thiocyanaticus]